MESRVSEERHRTSAPDRISGGCLEICKGGVNRLYDSLAPDTYAKNYASG